MKNQLFTQAPPAVPCVRDGKSDDFDTGGARGQAMALATVSVAGAATTTRRGRGKGIWDGVEMSKWNELIHLFFLEQARRGT